MNASGATFAGEDTVVRRCVVRDNGQFGFGAGRAHRLLLSDCVVGNNNTKGFDRGWEAGGNKLALCRDVVLERSCFLRNRGNGIWFDIGNTNCTVRQCLIADNEDAGIFYEISFVLHAHDNVILNNVYFAAPGQAWFEWGPAWAQHQSYSGLTAFQSALGIDSGGQVLDPGFVDLRQGDFRLRPETRDRLREHYPRGPVPGVILEDGL